MDTIGIFGIILDAVAGTRSVTVASLGELEERSVAPGAAVAASRSVAGASRGSRKNAQKYFVAPAAAEITPEAFCAARNAKFRPQR